MEHLGTCALLALLLGLGVGAQTPSTDQRKGVPEGLTASEWSGIRAARDAGSHHVLIDGDTHAVRCPGQRWAATFGRRGVTVAPDAGGWSWGLELVRYGSGASLRALGGAAGVRDAGGRIEYSWDGTLSEWFVNGPRGLEHGFTLRRRPAPTGAGPFELHLAVRGTLAPEVEDGGRGVRFVEGTGAAVLTYRGLTAFDADGRDVPARLDHGEDGLVLRIDDDGARYPLIVDPIVQVAYLKASNTDWQDRFGSSIAASGDTVVVGAPWESGSATGVNGNQSDNGAPLAGAAYVFVRNGAAWTQQAYLKASNTEMLDQFGTSVSISGDTVVVGASGEDGSATGVNGNQNDNGAPLSGAAYVFVRNGSIWTQQAYLKASNTGSGDGFGQSVSVSGDTIVVGAQWEDGSATGVNGGPGTDDATWAGAAYVFRRSGTTWSQEAYLKASNTGAGDEFGGAVSAWGDTVVVGAWMEASNAIGVDGEQDNDQAGNAGAAYVFRRLATGWSQEAYLKASNTGSQDLFGSSVAAAGDTVVVGARGESSSYGGVDAKPGDNGASHSGAAYVFVRNGTSWSQQSYLKASNPDAFDDFGWSVSLSGDTLLVGANHEDGSAQGVNGAQGSNGTPDSGAAYLFVRHGGTWRQLAYLKASNTGTMDQFGSSVSIAGDVMVVGAHREDSNATGINGDQANNAAVDAGAAYLIALLPDYQVNQAGASLDVDQVQGTAWDPAQVELLPGQSGIFALSSIAAGRPWDVGIGGAPLVPAGAGAFVTSDGQILNLDLADPTIASLWGGASSPPLASVSVPIVFSQPVALSLQMAVVDPVSPSGVWLSQPVRIVVPSP